MTTTSIARGKYHIWTVGCQMNQADSQRIQALLDEMGWEETSMDRANLVILNTCSVRKAPEEKAHNQLAQLKYAKERRDDLLVALMGCMIGNQKTIDELSKRYPHIDLFMKVEQADILRRFLEERWTPISGAGCLDVDFLPPGEEAPAPEPEGESPSVFAGPYVGEGSPFSDTPIRVNDIPALVRLAIREGLISADDV